MIKRNIINQCAINPIGGARNHWGQGVDTFDFYYYSKKVAVFHFNDVKWPILRTIEKPWAYLRTHDNQHVLTKISQVEDQIHGVDVIDFNYMQALYMEFLVNEEVRNDRLKQASRQMGAMNDNVLKYTANSIAQDITQNMTDAYKSFNTWYPNLIKPKKHLLRKF